PWRAPQSLCTSAGLPAGHGPCGFGRRLQVQRGLPRGGVSEPARTERGLPRGGWASQPPPAAAGDLVVWILRAVHIHPGRKYVTPLLVWPRRTGPAHRASGRRTQPHAPRTGSHAPVRRRSRPAGRAATWSPRFQGAGRWPGSGSRCSAWTAGAALSASSGTWRAMAGPSTNIGPGGRILASPWWSARCRIPASWSAAGSSFRLARPGPTAATRPRRGSSSATIAPGAGLAERQAIVENISPPRLGPLRTEPHAPVRVRSRGWPAPPYLGSSRRTVPGLAHAAAARTPSRAACGLSNG